MSEWPWWQAVIEVGLVVGAVPAVWWLKREGDRRWRTFCFIRNLNRVAARFALFAQELERNMLAAQNALAAFDEATADRRARHWYRLTPAQRKARFRGVGSP